jgi:hypothetical protein
VQGSYRAFAKLRRSALPHVCRRRAQMLGVARMVVGHTVQPRANAACDDQVWRIDVGMSSYYGVPMGIEIVDGEVTVLERRGGTPGFFEVASAAWEAPDATDSVRSGPGSRGTAAGTGLGWC